MIHMGQNVPQKYGPQRFFFGPILPSFLLPFLNAGSIYQAPPPPFFQPSPNGKIGQPTNEILRLVLELLSSRFELLGTPESTAKQIALLLCCFAALLLCCFAAVLLCCCAAVLIEQVSAAKLSVVPTCAELTRPGQLSFLVRQTPVARLTSCWLLQLQTRLLRDQIRWAPQSRSVVIWNMKPQRPSVMRSIFGKFGSSRTPTTSSKESSRPNPKTCPRDRE